MNSCSWQRIKLVAPNWNYARDKIQLWAGNTFINTEIWESPTLLLPWSGIELFFSWRCISSANAIVRPCIDEHGSPHDGDLKIGTGIDCVLGRGFAGDMHKFCLYIHQYVSVSDALFDFIILVWFIWCSYYNITDPNWYFPWQKNC